MGRNALPDAVKAAKGTLQPCRVNKNKPQVEAIPEGTKVGKIPAHLNKYGRIFYKDMFARLTEMGVLSENDLTGLELMASEYGVYIEAQHRLKAEGYVIEGTNKNGATYTMVSPWMNIAATKLKLLNGMMSKYGLNPSDRDKITTVNLTDDKDELESFLN
ncbi:phage terminase small subunit P27 family [Algoriphagus aquimarinus]|uniref:phage terminase small subunit P27 family n=1 Tax=Algoriphagus aquimarinus TaxID=237018 RepID=UPI0030DA762A|tara:strand:- start:48035 stop:48514 length:480 start_codon:yes stop_codon:yes gene_type:complete